MAERMKRIWRTEIRAAAYLLKTERRGHWLELIFMWMVRTTRRRAELGLMRRFSMKVGSIRRRRETGSSRLIFLRRNRVVLPRRASNRGLRGFRECWRLR